ncbi:DUF1758 domain-containing protein [Trichonephila clavata]|uniref:DUF1758 domain-containing protein n=1 Tax=Trichonephila clavata TaxID=2740835 RepID=A0A8X6FPH0_TRICU|nr:DUF1758 domain-containing protein [Trichonephila clavata]
MNDCLSGSSELTEFETLQLKLKQLLQRGEMTLHKWCPNLSPTTAQEEFPLDRNSEEIQVRTLGMIWNSIQKLSKDFQWKHISSEDNPADVISRGLDVKELATNDLWSKGPDLQNIAEATPNSLRVSSTVTD